jgi:acetyl esterase/lipase
MYSLMAYIIPWIVWIRFKGSFQSADALHARIKRERQTATHQPPADLHRRIIVSEREVGGRPVYDLSPKSGGPHRARLLYLHGGAFIFEIKPQHWGLAAELAEALDAVVTVPVYPLAPEHKLPELYAMLQPLHDETAATAAKEGVPFLLVGDSCGGNMALVLTQQAAEEGRPTASRMVLTTPFVDLSLTNPDMRAAARRDPFYDIPGFEEVTSMVMPPGMDPKVPLASPLYGNLSALPPMLVFMAEKDLLSPDATRLVDRARKQRRDVTIVEGKGMVHMWPVMPFHEGRVARKEMTTWLGGILQ